MDFAPVPFGRVGAEPGLEEGGAVGVSGEERGGWGRGKIGQGEEEVGEGREGDGS